MAPLPRAYQWADGSAYVTHVELVRKARGAEMPPSFWTDPLMYQGGSDGFIGPCDPILAARRSLGHRFRSRSRRHHRRRADGRRRTRGGEAHQAAHARQRRELAQSHPGGAREEFRFLPVEARDRLLTGRRDAGRARRSVERRQSASAAHRRSQRRTFRRAECRRRHDVFLPAADRARRQDAFARRGHDRRVRARCPTRTTRAAPAASPSGARWNRSKAARPRRRS